MRARNPPRPAAISACMRALSVAVLVLVSAVVAGQTPIDVERVGPRVGDRVPSFSAVDQRGTTQTLSSLLGTKGAMLVFSRSADW
jgi:hypothetical protein